MLNKLIVLGLFSCGGVLWVQHLNDAVICSFGGV